MSIRNYFFKESFFQNTKQSNHNTEFSSINRCRRLKINPYLYSVITTSHKGNLHEQGSCSLFYSLLQSLGLQYCLTQRSVNTYAMLWIFISPPQFNNLIFNSVRLGSGTSRKWWGHKGSSLMNRTRNFTRKVSPSVLHFSGLFLLQPVRRSYWFAPEDTATTCHIGHKD